MRVTMLAVGSRGDVQPYVALGLGLQRAGHDVVVATHVPFEGFVRGRGLGFRPLSGDPKAGVESEIGRAWLESGRNPAAFTYNFARLMRAYLEESLPDTWWACQGADLILSSALGFAGFHVAERLGVPFAAALLQPLTPTGAFPSIASPVNLGASLNRLSHRAARQMLWQPVRSTINRWRRENLGLPPVPLGGPFRRLDAERVPILYGYSPSVLPKPADWGAHVDVTGFWFLDRSPDWHPPPELVAFLESGPPPVSIGFGSMVPRDPAGLTEVAVAALRRAGRRGVLISGWGGLKPSDLPDDVCLVPEIPHDWLFPRMAATVHHGGAGTTAAGLRAGVPAVVTPFFADQPFWARRVKELGVGTPSIPLRKVTTERLATAIRTATSDDLMRLRAAALGQRIREENGVTRAVAVIEQLGGG